MTDLATFRGDLEVAVGPTERQLSVDLLDGAEEDVGKGEAWPSPRGDGTGVNDIGDEIGKEDRDQAELGELGPSVGRPVLGVRGSGDGRLIGGKG